MNVLRSPLTALLAVLLNVTPLLRPAAAQTPVGSLVGRVVEAGTEAPIPGVNLLLTGTGLGTATDPDGRFQLTAVPVGVYSVRLHRAHLVRADQIEELAPWFAGTMQVRLRGSGVSIPLARRRVRAVRARLGG